MIWFCTRPWTEVLVRCHNFLSLYLYLSEIQNLIAAKLPAHKIQKFHTLPNSHSTPVEMTAKSVGEGFARHFFDHHLPSPETLPKKIHFLQSLIWDHPPELLKSLSLPPPRPPHRNIPAGLPWPTRALAILVIRLPAGAASSTPSSTGPDHPRRTSKPYAHPAVYRSRFSCGIVHPAGAASPDPSSTASDLAHRHRCAWTGSASPAQCMI
jgi:hypothetical protein